MIVGRLDDGMKLLRYALTLVVGGELNDEVGRCSFTSRAGASPWQQTRVAPKRADLQPAPEVTQCGLRDGATMPPSYFRGDHGDPEQRERRRVVVGMSCDRYPLSRLGWACVERGRLDFNAANEVISVRIRGPSGV